jgi:hypothetical protein
VRSSHFSRSSDIFLRVSASCGAANQSRALPSAAPTSSPFRSASCGAVSPSSGTTRSGRHCRTKGTADDWFFKLWGLPFLAVGLYLIAGRFFYDAWVRNHSHYAVTNDRVLILRTSPTPKLISRDIQSLPMFELTEHRDGTGTIVFDSEDVGYSMLGRKRGFGMWAPAANANAQFFGIDDPRRVYQLIPRQAHS